MPIQVRSSVVGLSACGFLCGLLSVKRHATTANVSVPKTHRENIATRQPKASVSRPPSGPVMMVNRPRPVRAWVMTCAPSTGVNKSRVMARAPITPAPKAAPCTMRQPMKKSMDDASAQPALAST